MNISIQKLTTVLHKVVRQHISGVVGCLMIATANLQLSAAVTVFDFELQISALLLSTASISV